MIRQWQRQVFHKTPGACAPVAASVRVSHLSDAICSAIGASRLAELGMSGAMRDFGLEVFFSEWEFSARHHMTASDVESLSSADLLALASDDDRAAFENLWLGYTETWGAPDLRAEIAATYDTMTAETVLCHAGAGEGIYAVMRVLLDADDHVIVPVPNYQSAETVPLAICEVSGIALRRAGDWPENASGRGADGADGTVE